MWLLVLCIYIRICHDVQYTSVTEYIHWFLILTGMFFII